jgi:FkbM family methyltransferase
MGLFANLRYIARHPLNRNHPIGAIGRFARWQLASRLVEGKVAVPFVGQTRLLMSRGMHGATGNFYCGLHEFDDMAMLLHFLRAEDLFFDVGANIGSYTILAAGVIGARSVCFEPAPKTFRSLLDNLRLNGLEQNVTAYQEAVGGESGNLRFAVDQESDSISHVACYGETANVVDVAIRTLDTATAQHGPPCVIKIDVEGFEFEVIRGSASTLGSPKLRVLIMELIGSGARYGYDEAAMRRKLLDDYGFHLCRYEPMTRQLHFEQPRDAETTPNTLLVRDPDFVRDRIRTAPKITIRGVTF